jgi:hypothetical protein
MGAKTNRMSFLAEIVADITNKGNNKITELRTPNNEKRKLKREET